MLFDILLNIILPVFVLVGFGFLLRKALVVDVQSLSRTVLYLFAPALIFSSLTRSKLTGTDFAQIVGFVLLFTLLMGGVVWAASRALGLSQARKNAFYLSTLFLNAGNYGLPLSLFAYGQPGLERAVIFFATTSLLTNTVALYLASRGQADVRRSALNVLRMPMVYALATAILLRATGVSLPQFLSQPLELAGNAAVPVLLVTLGMELSQIKLDTGLWMVGVAAALRLLAAPLVALLVASILGLAGVTRQVCITQASMPTAVMTMVMAMEFGTDPRFVTSVVLVSTLASALTLTLLIGALR
ncbi:MAG: AEC family transporter [Deinococcus sp.]|nr:AEC family transporter [Deinococcus sp.]